MERSLRVLLAALLTLTALPAQELRDPLLGTVLAPDGTPVAGATVGRKRTLADMGAYGPALLEVTMLPFTTTPPPEGLSLSDLARAYLADPAYLLK